MESTEITWRRVRRLEEEYSFVRLLGSGAFGTCFLVRSNSSRKLCVLKALHESVMDELFEEEVDVLMKISAMIVEYNAQMVHELHQKNIMTYIDHFAIRSLPEKFAAVTAEQCTHCIVTEYVEGENMHDYAQRVRAGKRKLDPAFMRSLLLTALDSLHFLHDQAQVAHRDIKPGNILVTPDGRSVFIDFGLSVVLHRRSKAPQDDCGTPNYFSPSLVMLSRDEERATKQMWFASDIWGLGAACYYLCTGKEVARLYSDRERTFDEVLAFQCPAIVYPYNSELNTVICDMLNPDHHERPTAAALLERVLQIRLLRRRPESLPGKADAARGILHDRMGNTEEGPVAKRTRQMASLCL